MPGQMFTVSFPKNILNILNSFRISTHRDVIWGCWGGSGGRVSLRNVGENPTKLKAERGGSLPDLAGFPV